jgi:diacylglycerol kinase (ATP)
MAAKGCFDMKNGMEAHGLKRLYHATLNTRRGLRFAAMSEAALREELLLLVIAIPAGFFLAPSIGWYVAMVGSVIAILAIELLNTAVEKLADHVTAEFHPRIGEVKDIGSAAVFCGLALGFLVWGAAIVVRFGLLN